MAGITSARPTNPKESLLLVSWYTQKYRIVDCMFNAKMIPNLEARNNRNSLIFKEGFL
jgi:hypothetical protein